MMLARRLLRTLSTQPPQSRWRGFLQLVGRVSLVSVVAGQSSPAHPARAHSLQRRAPSTTSPTRTAIPARSSRSTPTKRPSSSSAAAGGRPVSSNTSTLKITTPSVFLLISFAFSPRFRSSSAQRTFSSSPPSSPPSRSAPSPHAPFSSVCPIPRPRSRSYPPQPPVSSPGTRPEKSPSSRQKQPTSTYVLASLSSLCSSLSSPSTRPSPLQVFPLPLSSLLLDLLLDSSPLRPVEPTSTIHYDYLVYAVGAETQTFGIPGVKEHACFMKEIADAEQVRTSRAYILPSHPISDAKTLPGLRRDRRVPWYQRGRKASLAPHGIFILLFCISPHPARRSS